MEPTQIRRSPLSQPCHEVQLYKPLDRAIAKSWRRYKASFQDCSRTVSEKKVHELRVNTRRLLAVLQLTLHFLPATRGQAPLERITRFLKRFAPLRDVQVQRLAMKELAHSSKGVEAFRKYLRDTEVRLRKRIAQRIKGSRLGKTRKTVRAFRKRLKEMGHKPASTQKILTALRGSFDVVSDLRHKLDDQSPESFHRLRVAFKKYRYMVEAIEPIFPAVRSSKFARMHTIQLILGEIQDLDVLRSSLRAFATKRRFQEELEPLCNELDERLFRQLTKFMQKSDAILEFAPKPSAATFIRTRPSQGRESK